MELIEMTALGKEKNNQSALFDASMDRTTVKVAKELPAQFMDSFSEFMDIVELLAQAAKSDLTFDEVERGLWLRIKRLGLQLLEGFVKQLDGGDLGATFERNGFSHKKLSERHERRLLTVFGALQFSRAVYGSREGQKHVVVPLDERLGLPDGEVSELLQDWNQRLCVQSSFDEARNNLLELLDANPSTFAQKQICQRSAQYAAEYRDQKPAPPPAKEGEVLVLTADGKGVPMKREANEANPNDKPRRVKGDKSDKKRQATVGGAYTVAPYCRTPEETAAAILNEDRALHNKESLPIEQQRPRPQFKNLYAELNRVENGVEINGKESIFKWLAQQMELRDPDHARLIALVMDGDPALWKMATHYLLTQRGDILCLLDIFHVLERLWSAAHCFHPEGSEEAVRFVRDRLIKLLRGEAGRLIGGLRQMATKHKLTISKKRQLNKAINYLQRYKKFLHYDIALKNGMPIGSGVVEGACRHLVKDRMEGAGMRWKTKGAQAILDLRAIFLNDDWKEFLDFKQQKELEKRYPQRKTLIDCWDKKVKMAA